MRKTVSLTTLLLTLLLNYPIQATNNDPDGVPPRRIRATDDAVQEPTTQERIQELKASTARLQEGCITLQKNIETNKKSLESAQNPKGVKKPNQQSIQAIDKKITDFTAQLNTKKSLLVEQLQKIRALEQQQAEEEQKIDSSSSSSTEVSPSSSVLVSALRAIKTTPPESSSHNKSGGTVPADQRDGVAWTAFHSSNSTNPAGEPVSIVNNNNNVSTPTINTSAVAPAGDNQVKADQDLPAAPDAQAAPKSPESSSSNTNKQVSVTYTVERTEVSAKMPAAAPPSKRLSVKQSPDLVRRADTDPDNDSADGEEDIPEKSGGWLGTMARGVSALGGAAVVVYDNASSALSATVAALGEVKELGANTIVNQATRMNKSRDERFDKGSCPNISVNELLKRLRTVWFQGMADEQLKSLSCQDFFCCLTPWQFEYEADPYHYFIGRVTVGHVRVTHKSKKTEERMVNELPTDEQNRKRLAKLINALQSRDADSQLKKLSATFNQDTAAKPVEYLFKIIPLLQDEQNTVLWIDQKYTHRPKGHNCHTYSQITLRLVGYEPIKLDASGKLISGGEALHLSIYGYRVHEELNEKNIPEIYRKIAKTPFLAAGTK